VPTSSNSPKLNFTWLLCRIHRIYWWLGSLAGRFWRWRSKHMLHWFWKSRCTSLLGHFIKVEPHEGRTVWSLYWQRKLLGNSASKICIILWWLWYRQRHYSLYLVLMLRDWREPRFKERGGIFCWMRLRAIYIYCSVFWIVWQKET
jgi:hypothetical protein